MKSRMSGAAHVTGEVVDFKELTTESGKKLAHLQIENADGRTWVLVPPKVYRRAEGLLESSFSTRTPVTIEGAVQQAQSQARFVAERINEL